MFRETTTLKILGGFGSENVEFYESEKLTIGSLGPNPLFS